MDLVSRIKDIVRETHRIEAETDVAAKTIAFEIHDARSRGTGLRESLRLQLRLMVGIAAAGSEVDQLVSRLADVFQIQDRLGGTDPTAGDMTSGLAALAGRYPWPETPPCNVERNEDVHFFTPATRKLLDLALRELDPDIVVEVGAWLGASTRMLLNGSHATVVSIDTWLGSEEHQPGREWMNRHLAHGDVLNNLYATFIRNCWDHRRRLIPMRTTSINGFHQLHDARVQPDLIFLDGAHDKLSIATELELAHALFPHARLAVDDYNVGERWLRGLVEAVDEFSHQNGFDVVVVEGQACILLPRKL